MTNLITSDSGSVQFLVFTCFVALLGGILFSFDATVFSGTLSLVEVYYTLDKISLVWFASSALVGAIAGAAIAGSLSDCFGRKPVLVASELLFFLSTLGCMIPPDFISLIIARFIGGIGVGLASVLASLYISEIAPAKIRGGLVGLYQLSNVIGILLACFPNSVLLGFSAGGRAISEATVFIQDIGIRSLAGYGWDCNNPFGCFCSTYNSRKSSLAN